MSARPRFDHQPSGPAPLNVCKFIDGSTTQTRHHSASLAVHWRRAPELEAVVRELMTQVAAQAGPDFELLTGASVLELKPCVRDKGTAVEAFLREPPFAGRVPLFVGDDATDADAFLAVERHGGWAIGVGMLPSTHLRLADPPAVRRWLARLTSAGGLLG